MRAVLGGLVSVIMAATIVAYAAHQWFYVMLLYGFLLGMTGGLMAWMVLDELDPRLQGTWLIGAAGLVTAALTYLAYEYLRFRFDIGAFESGTAWWAYLKDTAQGGAAFGRLGRSSTIDLGPSFVWGARFLELCVAMLVGGAIARAIRVQR